MHQPQRYLGSLVLCLIFWFGACTGAREQGEQMASPQHAYQQERGYYTSVISPYRLPQESQHTFDKTEVDLESGRLEPATHYQHPHGAHRYLSDTTEVDLALPLPSLPAKENSTAPAERQQ